VASRDSVVREYRLCHRDGSYRWIRDETHLIRSEYGEPIEIIGTLVDVTAAKLVETELRESELRFRQLAENIDQVFWLVDLDGRLLYVSPAYSHVWGRDVAELHSNPRAFEEAVHAEDRERVAAEAGNRTGMDLTYRIVRPDGIIAWIHDRSFPVRDEHGTVVRMAGIATDITAHRDEMTERTRLSGALATEALERAAMAESLSRLAPGPTAEATAAAICREVCTLPDVDGASVVILESGGRVVPLAVRVPAGAPVRVGRPVPDERAAYLIGRAAQGLWVETFRVRPEDGSYGQRWLDAGVQSAAYLPFMVDGEPAGLLVVVSTASRERLSARVTALTEYAAVVAGLLAPELRLRLRSEELRAATRRTIDERAFETVFQPVVELAGGAIVGFEALSRFSDGQSPEASFGAAEAAGLGLELEVATLRSALSAVRQLPPGAWLSVNVSPALATRRGILGGLLSQVDRQVVIEITERTAIADYSAVRRAIDAVAGDIRLAVDDAGAGFASLRHIVELRPQYVKLDRGLIAGIEEDPARQAMVAGMVYFANETGCALIAEGVETEGERRTLRRLGVPFGQGYLLGRPASADTWLPGQGARQSAAYSRTTISPEAKNPVT
jgi:PAS domain S-box-containing protein